MLVRFHWMTRWSVVAALALLSVFVAASVPGDAGTDVNAIAQRQREGVDKPPLHKQPVLPDVKIDTDPPPFNGPAPQRNFVGPKQQATLYTPFDAVIFAANDSLPADINPYYIRYLSLYNISPERRVEYLQVLSFAINSVSRARSPIIPYIVPGSDNTLVRIDLYALGIDPLVWDHFVQTGSGRTPLPEPYFQQFFTLIESYTETVYLTTKSGEWDYDYKQKVYKTKTVTKQKTKRFLAPALWLHRDGTEMTEITIGQVVDQATGKRVPQKVKVPTAGKRITYLTNLTQSQTPIIRADWFIVYGLWSPAYYDLLGLGKKVADFEKLIIVDEKKSRDVKLVGAIASNIDPQVALNNRFITRVPTISGIYAAYYYVTHDTKKSSDDRAYLNVIIDFLKVEQKIIKSDKKIFDATENIGLLRNGLQAYWLGDANGIRLDKADADIAQDSYTTLQDKQVWAARNCIMCHVEGIRPFREAVRNMAREKLLTESSIKLLVVDDDDYKVNSQLIFDLFSIPLVPVVRNDQVAYDTAVRVTTAVPVPGKVVTGLTSAQNARIYMEINQAYFNSVGHDDLALEAGYATDKIIKQLKSMSGLDFTLTGQLDNPDVEPTRRDQWENNAFPQLMQILELSRQKFQEVPGKEFNLTAPKK